MRSMLVIWALLSFLSPVYSLMNAPLTKLTTAHALQAIEENHIDLESMIDVQRETYNFHKDWILYNDDALKGANHHRHWMIIILGVASGILALTLAARWSRLENQANRHGNQSGES